MAQRYFGTDGIRGKIGNFPMTADFILRIGWAVGTALATKTMGGKVLIGKDTRISGYMIESALEAGLSAAGINCQLLGYMPTPGIAYLTKALRANAGIVISASHNDYDDNGIKIFSADGYKLPAEILQAIEYQLDQPMQTQVSKKLGKAEHMHDAAGRYLEYCKSSVPHQLNLSNLKIVVDCSNGAAYHIAPDVFSELGAHVITIHATPNGININENCGSNHPEIIRRHVLEEQADLGIAFDGDGDRVIMIDHLGEILTGDEILFIIANGLQRSKLLTGGVIGTEMSNMGLEVALNNIGIAFQRVPVGDQHIIEALRKKGWELGGEPSGHIIYLHVNTTADGIIAALQVLQTINATGKSLHELKKAITKFPHEMKSIPHHGVKIDLQNAVLTNFINNAKDKLGQHGRVNVRYSGTEPVIRLMIEGEDHPLVMQIQSELEHTILDLLSKQQNKAGTTNDA